MLRKLSYRRREMWPWSTASWDAFDAAWSGDPVSSFGSVIAMTMPVDEETARRLKGRFVEAVIAPDFEPAAADFLMKKSKDIRLLKLHTPLAPARPGRVLRQVSGGLLVQDKDIGILQQAGSYCPVT